MVLVNIPCKIDRKYSLGTLMDRIWNMFRYHMRISQALLKDSLSVVVIRRKELIPPLKGVLGKEWTDWLVKAVTKREIDIAVNIFLNPFTRRSRKKCVNKHANAHMATVGLGYHRGSRSWSRHSFRLYVNFIRRGYFRLSGCGYVLDTGIIMDEEREMSGRK
ncbi:hypothetical protein TNCV_1643371 [Trichonephila clavipes]|nr:hypothetical protein TNCV_1643371 [Trichonephila clavipes]